MPEKVFHLQCKSSAMVASLWGQPLPFFMLYSPKCVEGEFSEVRISHRAGAYARPRIFMHHHNMQSPPTRRVAQEAILVPLREVFMHDPASELLRIPLLRLYENSG